MAKDPSLIKELVRVIKPGGKLFTMVRSSQQLLPGYPLLEARLNTTSPGIAPFENGMTPENHFLLALGGFRKAGLKECRARTLISTILVIPPTQGRPSYIIAEKHRIF